MMPSAPAAPSLKIDPSAAPFRATAATVNFAEVFASEGAEVDKQCRLRGVETDLRLMPKNGHPPISDRLGLALSGGGIRSACVALGVIQALAQARILRQVHYISGISGGGYTLGWLTGWIHRVNATAEGLDSNGTRHALATVEEHLANNSESGIRESVANPPAYRQHIEPFPLHYLRRYSSYLNPRAGLLSGDTLAMISIYLRNVLLNQIMISCAALTILLTLQFPAFLCQTADILGAEGPKGVVWYGVLLPSAWVWPCATLLLFTFIFGMFFTWHSVTSLESLENVQPASTSPNAQPLRTPPQTPNSPNAKGVPQRRNSASWAVLLGVISCACAWLLFPRLYIQHPVNELYAVLGLVLLAIIGFAITAVHNWNDKSAIQRKRYRRVLQSGVAWFAVLIAGVCFQSAFHRWVGHVSAGPLRGSFLVFGLSAILIAVSFLTYLWVGIMGKAFPDSRREWLARAAGYLLAYATVMALLFSIAYFGPLCMHLLFTGFSGGSWGKSLASFGITGGWIITVLTGVLGGRSSRTSSRSADVNSVAPILNKIVLIAPPIFILGLLLCASFASHSLVRHTVWTSRPATYCAEDYLPCANWRSPPFTTHRIVWGSPKSDHLTDPPENQSSLLVSLFHRFSDVWRYWILVALCLVVALSLALCLDVNEFSLNLFYKNRLVRAFLGASRPEMYRHDGQDPRLPNPFTGFASGDDIELHKLISADGFEGPYPIWGTCLNLTTGEDLAWQQRKGASFIYSPLYSGWNYVNRFDTPTAPEDPAADPDLDREHRHMDKLSKFGYRSNLPSPDIPGYGGEGGFPWIGTAMAASGAAVSPNSGYHTSPGVAALLTLFNVRLGWWTGNPRHPRCWKEYAPGIWYLLSELLGQSNDRAGYVYLSDGGHFENLGIYELVRRHVRFIICSDADADPSFSFGDLGNAIDRCRRDFGVEINIKAHTKIAPSALDGFRDAHYAIGQIFYPGQAQQGLLLYIKSSLTSDEPGDVLGMMASDKTFPHNTTLNQFFDEKQFEAYRALGQHMMEFILQSGDDNGKIPMMPLDSARGDTAASRVHRLFDKLYAQI